MPTRTKKEPTSATANKLNSVPCCVPNKQRLLSPTGQIQNSALQQHFA